MVLLIAVNAKQFLILVTVKKKVAFVNPNGSANNVAKVQKRKKQKCGMA
jgi:hypothetical protein